jgi:hypothetical protein
LDKIISSRCIRGLRELIPYMLTPIYGGGFEGLHILPWLRFYDREETVLYDLDHGRPLYSGGGRIRYETLIYYADMLKQILNQVDRLCRED